MTNLSAIEGKLMHVKYTPQIVEGVMNRVLYEIGMKVWNHLHEQWGTAWDAPYFPLKCGTMAVIITETNQLDRLMEVEFCGTRIGTWLDSKREFYYAYLPDHWTDREFVNWATLLFEELSKPNQPERTEVVQEHA